MISCVMSVYDEPTWMIERAVHSLLKQTCQPQEIILVYDNPGNTQLLNFLHQTICPLSATIKLLINDKNRGLSYALNRGIKEARYDLICRMDADDESLPQRIVMELEQLRKDVADMVSTQVIVIDEAGNLARKQRPLPCSACAIAHISKYKACVFHPTWLFRKQIWERIGGYREEVFGAEDYDFVLRALKMGFKVTSVPAALLRYTERKNSISGSKTAKQLFLSIYAQNNVLRHREICPSIQEEIKQGTCSDFNTFKMVFENYINSTNCLTKIVNLIAGVKNSDFFRRLVLNTLLAKFFQTYYFMREHMEKKC